MLRIAEEILGTTALAFVLVILGYAVFSFLLARAHTARRGLGPTLRELLRETWLTGITQPLLPLYYVVGDRMSRARGKGGVPIVLVHGYMQNRLGFIGLARALARRGLGPIYAINYPWWSSIGTNAKRLERYVERVCRETESPKVDPVCHSMGGLVAMEMMRSGAGGAIRRCVTIATPHAGVAWRGPMIGFEAGDLRRGSKLLASHAEYVPPVPTLSVFSSHDNIVHPKETSSLARRGGRDLEVAGMAHFSILFAPEVAESVASFLSEPGPEPV